MIFKQIENRLIRALFLLANLENFLDLRAQMTGRGNLKTKPIIIGIDNNLQTWPAMKLIVSR